MARGKGRLKRSRRGAVQHSALATIFAVGVGASPFVLTGNYAGGQSALQAFQSGNWANGLGALSLAVTNNWSLYLFALIPVIIVALIAKKWGRYVHLSRHWHL